MIKIAHIVTNNKAATNSLITSFVAALLLSNCQRWDYNIHHVTMKIYPI